MTAPGLVNFQFIVNGYGDQSVSITPSSGEIASLGAFAGPLHQRTKPGGVLNSHPSVKVRTPEPKCEEATPSASPRRLWTLTAPSPAFPSHEAATVAGHRTSQPDWLAITSGRQR